MTPSISIEKQGDRWVARCPFSQKDIVKGAGFRWELGVPAWSNSESETLGVVPMKQTLMAQLAVFDEVRDRDRRAFEYVAQGMGIEQAYRRVFDEDEERWRQQVKRPRGA